MPTQSTMTEVTAAATGAARSDKARERALRQAKTDAKSAFDALRVATEKGQDGSVAADLIVAARTRLQLALDALKGV